MWLIFLVANGLHFLLAHHLQDLVSGRVLWSYLFIYSPPQPHNKNAPLPYFYQVRSVTFLEIKGVKM